MAKKIVVNKKAVAKKTEKVVTKVAEPKKKEAPVVNDITSKDTLFKCIIANAEGNYTKAQVSDLYDAFVKTFLTTASADSDTIKIVLPEIGAFKVAVKAAYDSKNPRTGEVVKVPAKKRITFKAYPKFSDKVNGKEA